MRPPTFLTNARPFCDSGLVKSPLNGLGHFVFGIRSFCPFLFMSKLKLAPNHTFEDGWGLVSTVAVEQGSEAGASGGHCRAGGGLPRKGLRAQCAPAGQSPLTHEVLLYHRHGGRHFFLCSFVSHQKRALGILPEAPTPLTVLTLSARVLARSWKNSDVKIGSRLVMDMSLMGCMFGAIRRTYSCDSGKLWSLWLWPNGRKNCFFTGFSGYSPGRLRTVCLSRRRCPGTCVLNKTDVCSPRPSVLQRSPALLGSGLLAPVTAWPGWQGLLWVGPFSASGATSV